MKKRIKGKVNKFFSPSFLVYRSLWRVLDREIDKVAKCMAVTEEDDKPILLDVGCGQKPYKEQFEKFRYFGINYSTDDACPDIVGDAQNLPVKSSSVDVVFSTQVIEHLQEPIKLVSEASRVLKTGGYFILSGPFYWPLHEEPFDFYRFTKYGFRYMLEQNNFKNICIYEDCNSYVQIIVSIINVLPPKLRYFIPLLNILGLIAEKYGRNKSSTLNYIVVGIK